ncbi:GNAT family N-acetyltransferase [Pontibacter sp. CAU 1760]
MIRPYTSADKNSLIQLLRLNTPAYFAPTEEADFFVYLAERAEHYYVYEADSEIIGCGGYNTGFNAGRTVFISWDIIHPNFQGKGIGKALLRYRIDRIKENPAVNKIVVRTTQHVYRFYQKAGFELQRVEADYWADGFDLYFMSRAV